MSHVKGFSMKLAFHPGQSTPFCTNLYSYISFVPVRSHISSILSRRGTESNGPRKMLRKFEMSTVGMYSPDLAPCDFWLFPRIKKHEPLGLGRFATDRCYAPQINGRYAALVPTLSTMEDVIYTTFYHLL